MSSLTAGHACLLCTRKDLQCWQRPPGVPNREGKEVHTVCWRFSDQSLFMWARTGKDNTGSHTYQEYFDSSECPFTENQGSLKKFKCFLHIWLFLSAEFLWCYSESIFSSGFALCQTYVSYHCQIFQRFYKPELAIPSFYLPRSSINTYVFVPMFLLFKPKLISFYTAKINHIFTVTISRLDISEHKVKNMYLSTENSLAISFWCDKLLNSID